MVKKLYKHEFIAWLRVLPLVWLITLAVSGIHRLVQLLETDTVYYDILNASGLIVFFVAIFACLLFPVIFGIVRFYRNFIPQQLFGTQQHGAAPIVGEKPIIVAAASSQPLPKPVAGQTGNNGKVNGIDRNQRRIGRGFHNAVGTDS